MLPAPGGVLRPALSANVAADVESANRRMSNGTSCSESGSAATASNAPNSIACDDLGNVRLAMDTGFLGTSFQGVTFSDIARQAADEGAPHHRQAQALCAWAIRRPWPTGNLRSFHDFLKLRVGEGTEPLGSKPTPAPTRPSRPRRGAIEGLNGALEASDPPQLALASAALSTVCSDAVSSTPVVAYPVRAEPEPEPEPDCAAALGHTAMVWDKDGRLADGIWDQGGRHRDMSMHGLSFASIVDLAVRSHPSRSPNHDGPQINLVRIQESDEAGSARRQAAFACCAYHLNYRGDAPHLLKFGAPAHWL
eukprot:COSAG04_NODE_4759_length_1906_cov_4.581546_2_plen_308_part_00